MLLAALLVLGAAAGEAQPPVQQVLLLQSVDRGNMIIDRFTGNFRVDLDRLAGNPVNVVQVVVGPTGFVGAPEQALVDYIRATFADRLEPDLIVTVAGPAAVFARKYRQQLFPETPLVFSAVDERFLRDAPLGENETVVAVRNDYPGLIDTILQLLPETRQVFMVMGSGLLGEFWKRELEAEFKRFEGRLTFVWSNDLALPQILRRCANLPAHSAVFYLAFGTDGAGAAYADERVLADLRAVTNAPVFGAQSAYFGAGVVGGSLMPIDDLSRTTADAGARLLNGAPPHSITVPLQLPGQPIFDWRELHRWNIPESRLPPGSEVRFRGPTLWSEYRGTVLAALAALIVQSLLIIGLIYERRARHRAEIDSRRNLALAADANRRETMSTLTSSIAHELSQPLTAIRHNAEALQRMVATNSATRETIQEILSDIEAQDIRAAQIIDRHRTMLRSRQLVKNPVDVRSVITESLALVSHDLKVRQIQAVVDLPPDPCIVNGDPVLLQQVFMNLVINAIDVLADTPGLRRITVRSEAMADEVKVSVRDTGTGLPAPLNGSLFTPFVTTKSDGLGIGLTIAQTIVNAHGGSIVAHNNPEGGATFTVTLHRDKTLGIRSGAAHPV